jgi:hypothetical protein
MTAKGGVRETIRSAFLDNIGLKILSLLCALGIYAFIHGAENAERTVSVSIVTIMPPESANRQILTQIPTEVKVTLRGTRTQLDDLRSDDLGTLNLNLRSGRETNIDLDPSMFRTPAGVSIAEINPPSIEIRWDDVVTHSIPVQIARTGEPAQSFAVKGVIRSEPANVQARGPRSIVDSIQYARSAPFDITGLTEGIGQERIRQLTRRSRGTHARRYDASDGESASRRIERRRQRDHARFVGSPCRSQQDLRHRCVQTRKRLSRRLARRDKSARRDQSAESAREVVRVRLGHITTDPAL